MPIPLPRPRFDFASHRAGAAAIALALLIAGPACRAGRPAPEDHATESAALTGRLLGATPLEADLRHLCDRIGGRPTGSPACERSVDWFAGRFREAGADRVATETFTVPRSWREDRVEVALTAPERATLRAAAMPFSPPAPGGGIEAPVVFLGEGSEADFQGAGGSLRGAVVLVTTKVLSTFEDLFNEYMQEAAIIRRAAEAGAAALLVTGSRERSLLFRHTATFNGDIAPLPIAVLAREDGLRLARLAAAGEEMRVRVALDLAVSGPFESRNVVADLRGRDAPDEVVLAGAHLDSWDLGTGALDNGANCVMLLDIARQMAAGRRPRRTVRFALFTGEEQGLWGSLGYVRSHRAGLDRLVAAVIVDTGTGRITGFSTGGRPDLRPHLERALAPAAGLGPLRHTDDAFVGTDNFDFLLEGVPNLTANQAPANYMENYHASSDTLDKADLQALRQNAALTAALVLGLAEAEDRAPRQDRAAIAALLAGTGLVDQMKAFGLWEGWEGGARGRAAGGAGPPGGGR